MWKIILTSLTGIVLCAAAAVYVAVYSHFEPPYWQFPTLALIASGLGIWGIVSLAVLTFKSATTHVAKEFKK